MLGTFIFRTWGAGMPSPCLSVFKDGQLPGPGFDARSARQWGQPWAAELRRVLQALTASGPPLTSTHLSGEREQWKSPPQRALESSE